MIHNTTIVALATAPGAGAIAVIRISGSEAIPICTSVLQLKSKRLLPSMPSHTVHLADIYDQNRILDEVLVTLFKDTNSYTGEPTVEISCHGSVYIQQEIIQLLLRSGCTMAEPGEFTLRAFLNGKMDLSQAEAVADLIASDSQTAHQMAISQMRGGFSNQIQELRQQLLHFASMLELELDFAEEDVEFADRKEFGVLIAKIIRVLKRLLESFALGNVLKNGVPVAIVGEPNVGKSTLLNTLLNEERAIVSDIAGTTRDTIEDEVQVGGITFRFIDTAGIRQTEDTIESLGIKKTFEQIEKAQIVIYMLDASQFVQSSIGFQVDLLRAFQKEIIRLKEKYTKKPFLIVANKIDKLRDKERTYLQSSIDDLLLMSARDGQGVDELTQQLLSFVDTGALHTQDTVVSNTRHYESLRLALEEMHNVQDGFIENVSSDLLAVDLRQALYHLGMITGEVTNDELLGNIFANFCIGK